MCIPAFFTCMRGIPYFSDEKAEFFGGTKTVKYRSGTELTVYKRSGVIAHNIALFANAY